MKLCEFVLFSHLFDFVCRTELDCFFLRYIRPLFFRTSLIRISVYPVSESGWPTNVFEQRAPRVLPEMRDRWLPTLVNRVLSGIREQFRHSLQKHNALNPVNSVNALYILLRPVILFYLHYINTFVLSELLHYEDRFVDHLVRKNEGPSV